MALTIPQGIYNIGAVQLNTQPLAALQGKLMAAEQERQAQLDKYFQSFEDKINPAGVRTDDENVIADKTQKWKEWSQQNKKALLKGDVNTVQQFKEGFQDIKNTIAKSKQALKFADDLNKLRLEGKIDPDDDHILNALSFPINDPRHYKPDGTEYGYGDLTAFVPEWDAKSRSAYFNNVARDYKKDKETIVGKRRLPSGDIQEEYELSYDPKNISKMAESAAISLPTDRSSRKYYNYLLKNPTDPRFIALKNAYDASGFHNGDEMDTIEELAKADIYREFFPQTEKNKRTINIPKASTEKQISTDLTPWDDIGKIWGKQKDVKFNGQTRKAIAKDDIPVDMLKSLGVGPEISDDGITEIYLIDGKNLRGFDNALISREALALKNAPERVREEYRKKQSGGSTPKVGKKTGAGGL